MTKPYNEFMTEAERMEAWLRQGGAKTGSATVGPSSIMVNTSPSQAPELNFGTTVADVAKRFGNGLGSAYTNLKTKLVGVRATINNDTLKNINVAELQDRISKAKVAQEAISHGINPNDGTTLNKGLFDKANNFFGSDLAKGLGNTFLGAGQLALGYKSYKEGKRMNNELIQDMRTNRQNLAADRTRAAANRDEFSRMMNTL